MQTGLYDKNDNLLITFEKLREICGLDLHDTLFFASIGVNTKEKKAIEDILNSATKMVVDKSMYIIYDTVFYYCPNMTDLHICATADVIQIDDNTNFSNITVDPDNAYLSSKNGILLNKEGNYLIKYPCNKSDIEYIVPDYITDIAPGAFKECKNLEKIIINDHIKKIENRTFARCKKLKEVKLSDKTKAIKHYAFHECHNLTYINIPKTISELGEYAFASTGITSFEIPPNVTVLERCLFDNAQFLKRIKLHDNIKFMKHACLSKTAIESITIPDSVQSIEEFALSSCGKLEEIILPNGLKNFENSILMNCFELKKMNLPKYLKSVGSMPLMNCNKVQIIYPGSKKDFESIENYEQLFENNGLTIDNFKFIRTLDELIKEGYNLRDANRKLKEQKEFFIEDISK